jgi:type IV pilus assembly protein PilW
LRGSASGAGLTLIELLVALAIGLFLVAGAVQAYVQGSASYRLAELLSRLDENARFALATLEPDIRLAGFWGEHNQPGLVNVPAGIAVHCDGDDTSEFALDLAHGIDARDDSYELPCPAFDTARPASDVLIVRRAGADAVALQAGQIQVQSSLGAARLFDDGQLPAGFDAASSSTHDLVVHAYYIDEGSSFAPGTPSLRRLALVRGATLENQEIIAGVENLQVQLGIDTNGDGTVERYVDRDHPALDPGAAGRVAEARVVAVRIWLLMRADSAAGNNFQDTHQHQPPDADLGPFRPGDTGYPADYPRIEISRTIYLRNLATASAAAA